ncbi:hypothetical protein PIB30_017045, partial [Stylosanthes scabra]|nr:hypothetical protein [Stylosanthes scabra]
MGQLIGLPCLTVFKDGTRGVGVKSRGVWFRARGTDEGSRLLEALALVANPYASQLV